MQEKFYFISNEPSPPLLINKEKMRLREKRPFFSSEARVKSWYNFEGMEEVYHALVLFAPHICLKLLSLS